MAPHLTWLAWTAALTAVLWIPYIVGRSLAAGMPRPETYRDPTPPAMPAWVRRADRAHGNAVESLAPFAALVLVADVAGVADGVTALWAMIYFWARVAHAAVFCLGIPYARTLAFAVGLLATLAIFWQVATAVPAA